MKKWLYFILAILPVVGGADQFDLKLEWTDHNTEPVVFEIWQTTDLTQPFVEVAEVNSSPWQFRAVGAQGFFKVRARSIATGLESPWATQ